MLPAVRRLLAALDIEVRLPRAEEMFTANMADVHHAVPSMFLAVRRFRTALDIEARHCRAGIVYALPLCSH